MKTSQILKSIGWMAEGNPRVSWSLEGYDHENRIFGCRAGPKSEIENIFHEFGHAIVCVLDGKPQNLGIVSYGLSLPYKEVLGTTVVEPVTGQMTFLECRVFGIQKALLESVGLDVRPNYFQYYADVTGYLPDWHKYISTRLKKKGFSYNESRRRRVSSLIARCYLECKSEMESIRNAWDIVCKLNNVI
jgi:hypothetical protein